MGEIVRSYESLRITSPCDSTKEIPTLGGAPSSLRGSMAVPLSQGSTARHFRNTALAVISA